MLQSLRSGLFNTSILTHHTHIYQGNICKAQKYVSLEAPRTGQDTWGPVSANYAWSLVNPQHPDRPHSDLITPGWQPLRGREAGYQNPLQHCCSLSHPALQNDFIQPAYEQPALCKSVMSQKWTLHPEGKGTQVAFGWKLFTGWSPFWFVNYHDFLSLMAVWGDEGKVQPSVISPSSPHSLTQGNRTKVSCGWLGGGELRLLGPCPWSPHLKSSETQEGASCIQGTCRKHADLWPAHTPKTKSNWLA